MGEPRFRVTLVDTGRSATVHLRAPAELAAELARDLDLPAPCWSSAGAGYAFPRRWSADIQAWLEWRGHKVRLSRRRRRDLDQGGTP